MLIDYLDINNYITRITVSTKARRSGTVGQTIINNCRVFNDILTFLVIDYRDTLLIKFYLYIIGIIIPQT